MNRQFELFDRGEAPAPMLAPVVSPVAHLDGYSKASDRFRAFHDANPRVYALIVEIARHAHNRGVKRLGMQAIFERIRWQHMIATRGDAYKLNNNYVSFYARLVIVSEPDLRGMFQTRFSRNHRPAAVA